MRCGDPLEPLVSFFIVYKWIAAQVGIELGPYVSKQRLGRLYIRIQSKKNVKMRLV
jgi:hypothetical protein